MFSNIYSVCDRLAATFIAPNKYIITGFRLNRFDPFFFSRDAARWQIIAFSQKKKINAASLLAGGIMGLRI